MSANRTCGVVGLGTMGSAMAAHLVDEGWTVIGFDADPDALAAAEDDGVSARESAAAVAADVDVLLSSLPTPSIVETVYLGEDGIAAGASGDLLALEMSTIDPETTERIADAMDEVGLVDAPVSGGPENARAGTLTLMVGGADDDVESDRAQAVLRVLGDEVYHLGGVGAGHTTKLLNNQIGAAVRAVSLEASAVAAARKIDLRTFMRVIRNSSGSSYQFRKRLPRVANRDFEGGFATEMSRKDVRLALEMADSVDARAYVTSIVHELYKEADAAGYGDEDSAAMVKLFEERTGVPFETDEPVDENFLDWYDM